MLLLIIKFLELEVIWLIYSHSFLILIKQFRLTIIYVIVPLHKQSWWIQRINCHLRRRIQRVTSKWRVRGKLLRNIFILSLLFSLQLSLSKMTLNHQSRYHLRTVNQITLKIIYLLFVFLSQFSSHLLHLLQIQNLPIYPLISLLQHENYIGEFRIIQFIKS